MNIVKKFLDYFEANFSKPRISCWRTIYVNLRTLPFSQAINFPVRIYGRVKLANLSGRIQIPGGEVLRIGRNGAGYVNAPAGRLFIGEHGVLKVGKQVRFSQGCNIFVGNGATLEVGDYSTMGDNAKVICYRHITIGCHCDLTWETQTTDFNSHFIEDVDSSEILPIIKEVCIGDYCWIGNRSSVMPGTRLPNRTIVTSNSLLNKDYTLNLKSYSLIGGIPAKLLKTDVRRIYDTDRERQLMKNLCQVQKQ